MSILEHLNYAYVLSGFGVGFLVGMTGVGGGSLMTPLLILLFGVAPEKAVATDLIYASITKTGGSLVHAFNRTIDWRIVLRLAAGSLPASVATLAAFHYLGIESAAVSALITKVLGIALLFTAAALIARNWLLRTYSGRFEGMSDSATRNYTILTGAVLGVLVTISSVGAGALGVTALILLYPRLPIVRIAASDIAHAVPLTLVAGIGHLMGGGIRVETLISLLAGSLPGIAIASIFAPKVPDAALRYVLAATLILVSIRMFV
ncbi:MAG: sulfite exporter TauE/SafE family protein [Proteobacteria bacterium]|nr:sulfite exporter TauE/SafE family protein [Pseudomonadota bacterium]